MVVTQLAAAAFLSGAHVMEGWSAASVGVDGTMSPAVQVGFGAILFVCLQVLIGLGSQVRRVVVNADDQPEEDRILRVNVGLWPRRRRDRALVLAVIAVNPVTEELLMRGVLVHQLGLLVGSTRAPAVLGLVLNGLLHAYQGWRSVPYHALFYASQLWILATPLGLLGCIGAHAVGDLLPVWSVATRASALRDARARRRRRSAGKGSAADPPPAAHR